MPKTRPLAILAALAVFGSVILAGSVAAHSRSVRFDPAPGAVLDAAPAAITGWFTSDIRRAEESFIEVLDQDGANVATDDVELSADRRQMSVALPSGLGEGRYVVYWSTLDDADGEVFSDCFAFFVGQDAADEALEHGESLDAAAECPKADEEHAPNDDAEVESDSDHDGDGGIPAWTLVLAIAGGVVVGGFGMKLVGGRA